MPEQDPDASNVLNPGAREVAALQAFRQRDPVDRGQQQGRDHGQRIAHLENFCYRELRGHNGVTVHGPNISLDPNARNSGAGPGSPVRLIVSVAGQGRFLTVTGTLGDIAEFTL